jgi:DNA-binding response OmpR family regulator
LSRSVTNSPVGAAEGRHNAQAPGGLARVIIVEDDWNIADLIRQELLEAGYDVIGISASAGGALVLASSNPPDIAVMDIRLSGPRDGVQAAQELRRLYNTRTLFISGAADPVTRERAQLVDPIGFLWKPFVSSQVVGAISANL